MLKAISSARNLLEFPKAGPTMPSAFSEKYLPKGLGQAMWSRLEQEMPQVLQEPETVAVIEKAMLEVTGRHLPPGPPR